MPNLYFYSNGYFFTEEKKNEGSLEFVAIDISTDRKGPVYTLVRKPRKDFKKEPVRIKFDLVYGEEDVPWDVSSPIISEFKLDTKSKFYSIYPLLKQMIAFNMFSENGLFHNHLFIQTIVIEYGNTTFYIDETISDKKLKKTFEYTGMTTDVEDIFNEDGMSYIGLDTYANKWERIYDDLDSDMDTEIDDELSNILKDYNMIIVPLKSDSNRISMPMETVYIMDVDYFERLHHVYNSMIITRHYVSEKSIFSIDSDECVGDGFPGSNYENEFFFRTPYDLLEASIFIPQVILMESKIYNSRTILDIVLEVDGNNLYLSIDEKESDNPKNICVFQIVRGMLEIWDNDGGYQSEMFE